MQRHSIESDKRNRVRSSPAGLRLVRDPAGFDLVVDATADDPISQSLCAPPPSLPKRWLKWLLGRKPTSHVPHLDLIRSLVRPGDRVLDLGAHIGTVSLALAAAGCEVVAVEPCPRNVALLRTAAKVNGMTRLRVIEAAVSDRPGTVAFCPRGPFGHVFTTATSLPSVSVRAVTVDDLLDDLGWDRVAFVKMDIEGSEVAVLRGMAGLLARADAPPILVESNAHTLGFYGTTPTELKAALAAHGYRSYRADARRGVAVAVDEVQTEVVVDYLAVKQGRSAKPQAAIESTGHGALGR